jgi:hypothetical protein
MPISSATSAPVVRPQSPSTAPTGTIQGKVNPPAVPVPIIPAQSVFNDPPWFTMPLDLGIQFPPELVSRYSKVLAPNGQFTSRLEHETKWDVKLEQLEPFRLKLEALVADQKLIDQIFGVDAKDGHSVWSIERVDKYYEKDASGKVKTDKSGKPILSPMVDTYYDTPDYKLSKAQAAFRFRELEGDTVNNINIKPGPGMRDDIGVATRVEYGLWVRGSVRDNPSLLKDFFQSREHLNPFRFLQQIVPGLDAGSALQPSVKISDARYKYLLKNENGLSVELSLDDVTAMAMRGDTSRRAHFGQLEMEVDHMQFGSNNVTQPKPEEIRKWLEQNGSDLGGAPRVHTLADINNEKLKKMPEYVTHTAATKALGNYLYGDYRKAPQAKQKAHVSAQMLGLI